MMTHKNNTFDDANGYANHIIKEERILRDNNEMMMLMMLMMLMTMMLMAMMLMMMMMRMVTISSRRSGY